MIQKRVFTDFGPMGMYLMDAIKKDFQFAPDKLIDVLHFREIFDSRQEGMIKISTREYAPARSVENISALKNGSIKCLSKLMELLCNRTSIEKNIDKHFTSFCAIFNSLGKIKVCVFYHNGEIIFNLSADIDSTKELLNEVRDVLCSELERLLRLQVSIYIHDPTLLEEILRFNGAVA